MKKKSVMMMFCLILVLALTGCRSKKETNDQSNQKERRFITQTMM